eukprot:3187039-Ditylum_brightwellii.AAC.1
MPLMMLGSIMTPEIYINASVHYQELDHNLIITTTTTTNNDRENNIEQDQPMMLLLPSKHSLEINKKGSDFEFSKLLQKSTSTSIQNVI